MNRLQQLRQDRARFLADARALLDKAEAEKRDLTAEEETQYEGLLKDAEKRLTQIQREERLVDQESQLTQRANEALKPTPENAMLGLTTREIQRYSLVRAINAAATGDWRQAGFEREASEAMGKLLRKDPQGFFVPYDWQVAEKRDLTAGTSSAGGATVQTSVLADNFINLLRNRVMTMAAGATTLTGLVGNIAIPRQTGGATGYWVAENAAPTASQQTFDQVAMSPKTVGANTAISRRLLNQSSIDVENFVRTDLAKIMALAIDLASLHGTGASNQPTGIINVAGIGSVAGGTNGAYPSWANIVGLETALAQSNADVGAMAYMTNAKARGRLKITPISSPYPPMIWDYASEPTPMNGYKAYVTNQVSSTLTKGSSSGICSAIFFADWSALFYGMWGGLDVLVDPYTGGTAGTVKVIVLQDVDINVRHPESFAVMADALTA